jgi:hydrogenase nickel incorporation protein HypB
MNATDGSAHRGDGYMSFHGSGAVNGDQSITASLIRQALQRAKVVAVNMVGGPGCGKTTLILQTLARLAGEARAGVIATNSMINPDAQHFAALTEQVAEITAGSDMTLSANNVRRAIQRLNLASLDLLFIENNTALTSANMHDLGESRRVVVFSVAAGMHEARKYAELVKWADAVVINKVDLLTLASFDLEAFRADINELNPHAAVFELSAFGGDGLETWVSWLKRLVKKAPATAATVVTALNRERS